MERVLYYIFRRGKAATGSYDSVQSSQYMEGDTFGIYEDGAYLSINVEGYKFKFLL